MKKRVSLVLGLLLAVSMVFGACAPAAEPQAPSSSQPAEAPPAATESSKPSDAAPDPAKKPDLVKVATTPHIAATAIWAADRLGYFAEENITVETTSFAAMAPAIAALASGDIDISYMGVGVHALAAKGQVKIFAVNNLSYGDYFIGNKKLGAADIASLEKKTIAVPKGSTGDMLVNMVLKKNGLDPANYNIVNMDAAGVVAAMTAGKIDACGIWEPFITEITTQLGKDNIAILGEGKAYADDIAFIGSYGANEKMFTEKRDVLVRFTRAYAKATDYLAQKPEEFLKITMEETQGSKEAIEAQLAATKMFTGEEFKTVFTDGTALKWYDSLMKAMLEVGVVEEATPSTSFVDTTIITEALK